MGVADLHLHSTCSDGEWSPSRLVKAAHRERLQAIALTDHDTLAGVPEALEKGERLKIRVIPACEISAWFGFDLHLLAYGVELDHPGLSGLLRGSREGREARALEIVAALARLGMPMEPSFVLARVGGGVVGRPHIARALVDSGYVKSVREAFDLYLGDGKPACVEKPRVDPKDAIQRIHDAAGIAVVAHPGSYGGPEILDGLLEMGLDGIEVLHSLHGENSVRSFEQYALAHGLCRTGGSDFHGPRSSGIGVGSVSIEAAWLEELLDRIKVRRELVEMGNGRGRSL
jgi:hypothetical protein